MSESHRPGIERLIGRLLVWLTYLSVALLVVGVGLMLAQGISPLDGGPAFDPNTALTDIAGLRPAGFLWLGLIAILVTPIARVAVAGVGFALDRQWVMVLVAMGILAVIAIGVASTILTEA